MEKLRDHTDQENLERLLSNAVKSIISLAKERDLTELPREEYIVNWLEPVDETRSEGKQEVRSRISHFDFHELTKGNTEFNCLVEFVEKFVEEKAKLFWWPMRISKSRAPGILLIEYFNKTTELKHNKPKIRSTVKQFLQYWLSETIDVSVLYRVQSFSAEKPFRLSSDIAFRTITMDDIERDASFGFYPSRPADTLNINEWICEIRRTIEKGNTTDSIAKFNFIQDSIEPVINALSLSHEGRATFDMLEKSIDSPYAQSRISGGNSIFSSHAGEKVTLNENGIKTFRRIYKLILGTESGNHNYLQLPLRRLRASSTRMNHEDHLIDCVIGLESLLAADSPQLETTYRFRLRGAALLPATFGNPTERMHFMNKLYSLRSAIVHGRANQDEIKEYSPRAEDALKAIILWYFRNGATYGKPQDAVQKIDRLLVSGRKIKH